MKRKPYPSDRIYRSPIRRHVTSGEHRLWTVMHPATFDLVLEHGAISGSKEFVDEYWDYPYRWMMEQMGKRIPGYNGQFPVWAWHSPKPDLRWSMFREWSRPAVLVEWVVPAESMLLSDFDLWHAVLNWRFLSLDDESHEAWD